MARVRNTMKLVRASVGKVNDRYDMCVENVMDIQSASRDSVELICNSFRFGYMQGMKAAKAEMK